MPIQLPEIKENMDQGAPSVGRIQTTVASGIRDQAEGQQALTGFVGEAIKYRNQVANQEADNTATERTNQYQLWKKKQLYGDPDTGTTGIIFQKGNPVDLYKQFDEDNKAKLTELSSNDSWSTETQNLVDRRLTKAYQQGELENLTEYGNQKSKYDESVRKGSVELSQQAMPQATTYIDPDSIAKGDRSSLAPLDAKIADIKNTNISGSLTIGSAKFDENGDTPYTDSSGKKNSVFLQPSAQEQIGKDLSKGLYDATDNLINTSRQDPTAIGKAKVMMDQYGKYIDPLKRAELEKSFSSAQVSKDAYELTDEMRDKSPDQIKSILADVDGEVRHKALEYRADEGRYIEAITKQKQDANYQLGYQAGNAILKANPAATWSMAQANQGIQTALKNATPEQRHALESMFNPPKVSDPNAIATAEHFMSGQDAKYPDITQAPAAYVNQIKAGLNNSMRTKIDNRMQKMMDPANMSQSQNMARLVRDAAINANLVRPDDITGTIKPGSDDFKQLGEIQNRAAEAFRNLGPLNLAQQREEAGKFIASQVGKNPAPYVAPKRFKWTGPAFGTPPPPPQTPDQIQGKALKDYALQNPDKPRPNGKQLQNFINSDTSGRYK